MTEPLTSAKPTQEIETWAEIKDRHALEKAEALTKLRDMGLTQTQAADVLGTNINALYRYLKRNSIPWTAMHYDALMQHRTGRPSGLKIAIATLFSDGRERTLEDIHHAISGNSKSISAAVSSMRKAGLLRRDFFMGNALFKSNVTRRICP